MKDPVVHETLRQIQDIVTQETGAPLAPRATTRVEKVLTSALGQLAGTWKHGGNLTHEVTILLADLRGFTSLSAAHPAGLVLDLLNRCFVRMSEIIFQHGGGIDKFMGDSILVIFESKNDGNEAVKRALHCAVDMQLAMEALNQQHRDEGWPEMYFGIGINTGRVMAALLGSELYWEHTVIGDEVNLASRERCGACSIWARFLSAFSSALSSVTSITMEAILRPKCLRNSAAVVSVSSTVSWSSAAQMIAGSVTPPSRQRMLASAIGWLM